MKIHPNSEDADLVKACLKRNPLGQKYLYQKYYSPMLNLCMRYAREKDEAVKMLNTAFFKVLTSLEQYQGKGDLGAWIRRIVCNTAIDALRAKARYQERFDVQLEVDGEVSNEALSNLGAEEILKKIQALEPTYRMVFCMHAIDGYKHHEIASKLNISVGTSKWYLSKAKEILQQKILTSFNIQSA